MPARRVLTDDGLIAQLYRDGYDLRTIAGSLGLSLTTVWRRLRAGRITMRPKGHRPIRRVDDVTDISDDLAAEMTATLWHTLPDVRAVRVARLLRICALLYGHPIAERVRDLVDDYAAAAGWWEAGHDRA